MYKKIFQRIFVIISQPAKSWNFLSADDNDKENGEAFLKSYIYPIFGLITLIAFVGLFINGKYEHANRLEMALLLTIKTFLVLFSGFFLASFFLNKVVIKYFSGDDNFKYCQKFVGYASSLIYVLIGISLLLPWLKYFSYLFSLYTVYIIWNGSLSFMHIKEEMQVKFTAWASVIILFSPFLIEVFLNFLFDKGLGEVYVLFPNAN